MWTWSGFPTALEYILSLSFAFSRLPYIKKEAWALFQTYSVQTFIPKLDDLGTFQDNASYSTELQLMMLTTHSAFP